MNDFKREYMSNWSPSDQETPIDVIIRNAPNNPACQSVLTAIRAGMNREECIAYLLGNLIRHNDELQRQLVKAYQGTPGPTIIVPK